MFLPIDNEWKKKHHIRTRNGGLTDENSITSCNAIDDWLFKRK